jgi:uncharacterized Zn-binding protein involved in type VI secretion
MPAVARKDDTVLSPDGSGYKCRMPLKTKVDQVNSDKVYANNILIVVQGNRVALHNKSGCTPDTSTLSSYSSSVFIGGKNIGRIGDEYSDNIIIKGSESVFAGG